MTNRLTARVTSDPAVMMGKPVIKGTRIPVELILRHLGAGDSEQQILADVPRLTNGDIRAAPAPEWLTINMSPQARFTVNDGTVFCEY